ncbi:hypothetical protein [Streptomyces smyrnaeus]|uniref:hypothetical protein n=1 Tax=Streptomyces smyrnaeus TaxID=1387713 RepID=UPI001FD7A58C|nr:hypothetical protein [Streptomyces smyrnaeus]
MAIPGAQPQQPYSQQPTSTATPAYQFNPYAQPQTPPPGPPGPPGQPPGGPVRGGGPRWLWALGGVVVASVTWAATLMATGALDKGTADSAAADFKGYRFHHDMCETAKLKSFQQEYRIQESSSDNPDGYSSRQKGLDVSRCSRTLIEHGETSKTPPTTYVSTTVTWHKKSDPAPEFASEQRTWEDQKSGTYQYEVSPVDGFGDEAYLIKEERGDSLGRLMLEVRAGWMTYEMSWSWFGGGIDEDFEPPSEKTVTGWMKKDTRATLAALKKPDSKKAPGRDPGA